MRCIAPHLVKFGLVAGLLAGCGNPGGLPSITPSVNITSPANNSTVNLSANKLVAVNFTTNYMLKDPGTCGTIEYCGHVYVLIDNTSCNNTNMVFNKLGVSSPAEADFSKCAMPTGMHTISLELHHDDGTLVKDLINNPVVSKVTVTTQ